MKQMGAIPTGFSANDAGHLVIGGEDVETLIARAGDTPLFVYDFALIRARIASLREALPPEVAVHYAIKANPMPELVAEMALLVDGLDVASEGEMGVALGAGARHISFAGPGKRDRELEAAICAGVTLNLESEGEATRALGIAERLGTTPKMAVRVNPNFDLKGSGMRMGGGAKPFGVDSDRAASLVRYIRIGAGFTFSPDLRHSTQPRLQRRSGKPSNSLLASPMRLALRRPLSIWAAGWVFPISPGTHRLTSLSSAASLRNL